MKFVVEGMHNDNNAEYLYNCNDPDRRCILDCYIEGLRRRLLNVCRC